MRDIIQILTKGCAFSFRVWIILRRIRTCGTAEWVKWKSVCEPSSWKQQRIYYLKKTVQETE
jgi:hypothetical protein